MVSWSLLCSVQCAVWPEEDEQSEIGSRRILQAAEVDSLRVGGETRDGCWVLRGPVPDEARWDGTEHG